MALELGIDVFACSFNALRKAPPVFFRRGFAGSLPYVLAFVSGSASAGVLPASCSAVLDLACSFNVFSKTFLGFWLQCLWLDVKAPSLFVCVHERVRWSGGAVAAAGCVKWRSGGGQDAGETGRG